MERVECSGALKSLQADEKDDVESGDLFVSLWYRLQSVLTPLPNLSS